LSAGLALCLVLCTAGCTVSLATAYRIIKESHEVRFVPGQIPELSVRSSYTLENYGNGDLASIDVILPDAKSYGLKARLIKVDGREASPVELSEEPATEEANRLRITFDSAWNQKQRRDLVIEYALSSPEDSGMNIALSSTSFHVVSRGWFPRLQPPAHVLSPSPASPVLVAYTVQVPTDFLLLAPGKPTGRTKNGGEVKHRFELRESDSAPFIVSGRYVDSCSNVRECGAAFWTLEPLKGDRARAQEEIASAWHILQNAFGPLQKGSLVPHIVESLGQPRMGGDAPTAVPFFGGVLVNSPAISLGADNEDFLDLVTRALAGNWFGVRVYSANSNVGMNEGLSDYAVIVIDEARHGDSARSIRVLKFLDEYDNACKGTVEKPLVAVTKHDPVEQRRIALAKAPLFFIALEDMYGGASVRKGLAQVVSLLRGQEVGYQDIRAAIENITNKDLAPIFRTWLYKPGIPAEFRGKYQSAGARKK
jgi:hypothetical protein